MLRTDTTASLLKAAFKIKDTFKNRTKKSIIYKKKPSETQLRKRQPKKASAGMVVTRQFLLSVIKRNELSWRTGLPARSASLALTKTALPRAAQLLRLHKTVYFLMWLQWSEMEVRTRHNVGHTRSRAACTG